MKQLPWLLIRLWVGGLFAAAGWFKLTAPVENFQAVLAGYPLLPHAVLPTIARVIPWVEWLGGMGLLLGFNTRFFSAVLTCLTLGFLTVLTGPVFTGQGTDHCGCFSAVGPAFTVTQMYLMDWINLFLLIFLLSRSRHPLSFDNLINKQGQSLPVDDLSTTGGSP